jgi:hypothetical protein
MGKKKQRLHWAPRVSDLKTATTIRLTTLGIIGIICTVTRSFGRIAMLDELDRTILAVAYNEIALSVSKRVAGGTIWEKARAVCPDLAPVTVPARLNRLISKGLLVRDPANSSNRTKVYAPTDAGSRQVQA